MLGLALILWLLPSSTGIAREMSMDALAKDAIKESLAELHLTPEQKKSRLDEEVVTSATYFIQDLDMSASGLRTSVNLPKLRAYMSHWGPAVWHEKKPSIVVDVRVDPHCGKVCVDHRDLLFRGLKSRWLHRGYIPVVASSKHADPVKRKCVLELFFQDEPGVRVHWELGDKKGTREVMSEVGSKTLVMAFRELMVDVFSGPLSTAKDTSDDLRKVASLSVGETHDLGWGISAQGVRSYSEMILLRDKLGEVLHCSDAIRLKKLLGQRVLYSCSILGEKALRDKLKNFLEAGVVLGAARKILIELKGIEKW